MLTQGQSSAMLFIDGPNVSRVLGEVLNRKPNRLEWPRWNRLLDNLGGYYKVVFEAHYVANGNHVGDRDWPFYRQLRMYNYNFHAPKGYPIGGDGDPVDDFLRKEIDRAALSAKGQATRVVVASHDHGYAPHLQRVLDQGGKVTVVGFREWLAPALLDLEIGGAHVLDIEHDLGVFDCRLDRPYSPSLPIAC
jgi:hypothetical protein